MMESMNVLRVSEPFPPSEAPAAFLVFFFFDSIKIKIIMIWYSENHNLFYKKWNLILMIDFWQKFRKTDVQ